VTAYQNTNNTKSSLATAASNSGFNLGQQVHHNKFGDGVILQQEGDGSQARVQVNFENAGSKWLVLAYANLTAAS
jgi:DNA helicase-2/ATP-dependent DNA helicase PcrA